MSQSSTYADDAGWQGDDRHRVSQVARATRLQTTQAMDEPEGLDGIVGDVQRFSGNGALNRLLQRQEAPGRKPTDGEEKDPHHKQLSHQRPTGNEAPGTHTPTRATSGAQAGHSLGSEAPGTSPSALKAYGIHGPVKSLLSASNANTHNLPDDAYYGFDNQLHYGSAPGPIQVNDTHNGTPSVSPSLLKLYQKASVQYRVPLALLLVQGADESDFNPTAVGGSPPGYGIAQFTGDGRSDAVAHKYLHIPAGQDWHAAAMDPTKAIPGQAYYMEDLYAHPLNPGEQHSWETALSEYNGGGNWARNAGADYGYRILVAAQQLDSQLSSLLTHHVPPPPPRPHGSDDGIAPGTTGHINAYDVPLEPTPGAPTNHKLAGGETITAIDSGSTHRRGWVYVQVTDGSLHGTKGWIEHHFMSPGKAAMSYEHITHGTYGVALRTGAGTNYPLVRTPKLDAHGHPVRDRQGGEVYEDVRLTGDGHTDIIALESRKDSDGKTWDQVLIPSKHVSGWVEHSDWIKAGKDISVPTKNLFDPVPSQSNPFIPFGNPDCTLWAWEMWHRRGVDPGPPWPAGGLWSSISTGKIATGFPRAGQSTSITVNLTPAPGAIANFGSGATALQGISPDQSTPYTWPEGEGHVAYILAVLGDGWFMVTEESWKPSFGPRQWCYKISPENSGVISFLHCSDVVV